MYFKQTLMLFKTVKFKLQNNKKQTSYLLKTIQICIINTKYKTCGDSSDANVLYNQSFCYMKYYIQNNNNNNRPDVSRNRLYVIVLKENKNNK